MPPPVPGVRFPILARFGLVHSVYSMNTLSTVMPPLPPFPVACSIPGLFFTSGCRSLNKVSHHPAKSHTAYDLTRICFPSEISLSPVLFTVGLFCWIKCSPGQGHFFFVHCCILKALHVAHQRPSIVVCWLKKRELSYSLAPSHRSFIHTVNACSGEDSGGQEESGLARLVVSSKRHSGGLVRAWPAHKRQGRWL